MKCAWHRWPRSRDIIFGRFQRALSDLERITKMAYSIKAVYGMNEEIETCHFTLKASDYAFQKPYSDNTAQRIDEEVKKIIDACYKRTKDLLSHHREHLSNRQELLKKEILFQSDLERLIVNVHLKANNYSSTNGSMDKTCH